MNQDRTRTTRPATFHLATTRFEPVRLAAACLATALVAAVFPLAPAAGQQVVPPGWSPELGAAMRAYDAGDYGAVLRECTRILSVAREPRLRRDAAALEALTMLRNPGRNEQMAGRGRLGELASEDPALMQRPEVQLAYGVSLAATFETAAALKQLHEAATAFAAREDGPRLRSACIALAACWARHAEWADTPPELRVRTPGSPEEARHVRRAQIEAVRGRLERLPDAAASLEEIDLILGRLLMEADDTRAEGQALLERLATTGASAASAQACISVAAACAQQRRWEDALALYGRVEAGPDPQLVSQAREAADAIRRPQAVPEVSPVVPAGQPVIVGLRARNLERVELEIRRVDLASWLTARRGVFSEAALPLDGALTAAGSLETRVDRRHDWWQSGEEGALRAALAPGSYVLVARAAGGGADEVSVRRLLLVSDLRAAVFVGRGNVAIWATAAEGDAGREPVDPEQATARFWMHGSFVPQERPLPGGAALMPLPPESRILRDRGWTCLVQAGPHVALCQGRVVHESDTARDTARVILAAAPPDPRAGETVRFLGLLRERDDGLSSNAADQARLELRDLREVVRLSTPLSITPAGTFLAALTMPRELAGQTLNAVVLRGPRTIENVRGRLAVRVHSLDETPLLVRLRAPRISPPLGPPPSIEVAAAYPWGTPAADARAFVHFRALRLPAAEPYAAAAASPPVEGTPAWVAAGPVEVRSRLDAGGRARLVVPLGRLSLPEANVDGKTLPARPVAYGAWADVFGPDGRGGRGSAEFLRADAAPVVWVTLDSLAGGAPQEAALEPSAEPRPVHFGVHWFDPGGALSADAREVVIRRGEQDQTDSDHAPVAEEVARLPLFPAADGLRTDPWMPAVTVGTVVPPANRNQGTGRRHTVEAVLPVRGGESIRVARPFDLPRAADETVLPQVEARWTGSQDRPEVSVRVTGSLTGSKLLLCEADELLALQPLRVGPMVQEARLSLKGGRPAHAQVFLLSRAARGIRVERVAAVRESEDRSVRLGLNPLSARVRPATRMTVRATCQTADGQPAEVQLSARLVDLRGGSTVPWVPGDVRRALLPATAATVSTGFGHGQEAHTTDRLDAHATGRTASAASGPLLAEPVLLPAALNAAMVERATVWVDSRRAVGGAADFEVAIPPAAGFYRLWVIAQSGPDHIVISSTDLDASDGPALVCDLPAQMTLGDRTRAALTLVSERELSEATVTVRGSPGLRMEPPRPVSRRLAAADEVPSSLTHSPDAGSVDVRVTLRPAEPLTLVTPLEATAPGEANVRFEVVIDGTVQIVSALGMIHPADVEGSSSLSQTGNDLEGHTTTGELEGQTTTGGMEGHAGAAGTIHVRRSLMLLSQVYTGDEDTDAVEDRAASRREWLTSPIPPDGRLLPGQLVLVREEFELSQPLEHVVWSQRLPPTWHTYIQAGDAFRPPGTPAERRLDELSWSAPRLRAGPALFEYAVAVVRPGAAVLPAPQVTAGGKSVPVQCTPEDLRTVAVEPQ